MRFVAWLFSFGPKYKREGREPEDRGERFMNRFVTTYRLPFDPVPTIAIPANFNITHPKWWWLFEHEMVHANDMRGPFQLFRMAFLVAIIPLPIILSGRWYIERDAFWNDIKWGIKSPERVAQMLWDDYFWAWPKKWVIQYYRQRLRNEARGRTG